MGNINEDSVGSLLPVTEPDEVLRKEEGIEPTIDEAFNALCLTEQTEESNEEEFTEDAVLATFTWSAIAVVVVPIAILAAQMYIMNKRIDEIEFVYASKDKKFVPLGRCEHRLYSLDQSALSVAKATGDMNKSVEDLAKMRYGNEITRFKWLRSHIVNKVHELWYRDEIVLAFVVEIGDHGTGWTHSGDGTTQYVTTRGPAKLYIGINKKYKAYAEYMHAYVKAKYASVENAYSIIKQLHHKVTRGAYVEEGVSEDLRDVTSMAVSDIHTEPMPEIADMLQKNGIESVVAMLEKQEDAMEIWGEEWEEDQIYTESAKIDEDIKDIIDKLNVKGYKTVYSCSGHPGARLKSDRYKDGIKDGKLYSTARVVFDKNYEFASIPKYWELKILDKGQTGIYVKGPTYKITNGMAPEQFTRWKRRYMYNLEKWVDELPSAGKPTKSKNTSFQESADDLLSVAEDVLMAALSDL